MVVKHQVSWNPENCQKAIKEEIEEMLRNRIIKWSTSPWSSSIAVILKLDSNDFQHLNQVSEFDCYPLPWIDDLLKRLERAQIISTIYLTKAYW